MLPIVLNAPRYPTVFPLSERDWTEYFTREGVTVPSRNSGNTNTAKALARAAQTKYIEFTERIMSPESPTIIYFPSTGISAIQTPATRILPYRMSGFGFLSALLPP